MQLPVPLQSAILVRRYKRFLVDCTLTDATPVTAHIADPGRLPGLVDEGARLWLSTSEDPRRKLAHRVELIESGAPWSAPTPPTRTAWWRKRWRPVGCRRSPHGP